MTFFLIFFTALVAQSLSTISHTYNIGNGVDPINAFSAGEAHITIAYGTTSTDTVTTIKMYDTPTNTTTIITNTINLIITSLHELKGTNTPTINVYIIQEPSSLSQIKDNFTNIAYQITLDITIPQQIYSCFGATTSEAYYCYNSGSSMRILQFRNNLLITIYGGTGDFCRGIAYENQYVFAIVESNLLVFVYIYSTLDNSLSSNQTFSNPIQATNLNIQATATFYTVSFGQSVYVYYVSNYSTVCNLTSLRQNVYDIKINDHWIYVSFSNIVEQYDIGSCMLFGNYSTNTYKLIQTHQAGSLSTLTRIFLLTPGEYSIDVLNVEDRYVCAGGCASCINYYGLDGNAECYYTGIDNSTAGGGNGSNITNTTTINTTFNQLICSYKCQVCSSQPTNCTECSYRRTPTPTCQLPTSISVIYTAINLANTFRPSSSQFAYYFIDNLQLYQYHSKHYTGIINEVLIEINYVESIKWSVMSVDNVLDWTRRSYFNNSLYNQYTNYRFLEVERENALIYETTKAYYTLYLLVVFVGFLVLNRLFKCLQRFRVSQILRVYSFWLHYVFIVVLSDSTKLSFLSLNYLQMLFSFSINTKILHAVSILLIGVLIIVLLSLFFMSSYLYGNLCRYFLGNVYRIKYAIGYNFLRFSVRPLVEAALHVLFFANGKAQLLSLSCLQIVSIALMIAYEINYNAFKSKVLFACDILLSFGAALLNLLLYWQYYAFFQCTQVVDLLEFVTKSLIYINIIILVLIMIYSLLAALKSCFTKKTEVNNPNQNKEKQAEIVHCILQEGQQMQKAHSQFKSKDKAQKHKDQKNIFQPLVTQKVVKKKQIHIKCSDDKTNNNLFIKRATNKGIKNAIKMTIRPQKKQVKQDMKSVKVEQL